MTFGEDPFRYNKDDDLKNKKGASPFTFFIIFLILWYMFSRLAF
jgi:hypothetical protein